MSNPFDYGLHYVSEHNARLDSYGPDGTWDSSHVNFDIDEASPEEHAYVYTDPQRASRLPSQEAVEATRTRSGRVVRRTQSPASMSHVSSGRISKSPKPKRIRADRARKANTMNLPGPLSQITRDSKVPIADMEAWLRRPREKRIKKDGKTIMRPMNQYMLYRTAYMERIKEWCKVNNHQKVSAFAGASWNIEPGDVQAQFVEWARIEKETHAALFPDYKFSPSKPGYKGRDELDDGPDPDEADGDDEYLPSQKHARRLAPSYNPSSQRSDSPAVSEAYPSSMEFSGHDYPWLPQQFAARPPPMQHRWNPHEQYQVVSPLGTVYGAMPSTASHFAFSTLRPSQPFQQQQQQQQQHQPVFPQQQFVDHFGSASVMQAPMWSENNGMHFDMALQSPGFGVLQQSRDWPQLSVDPRLMSSDLDAAYERDFERDRAGP